jgi:hypothetical protein
MDIIPEKITIIVFAQGLLVLLLLLGNSWRRRRERGLAAESTTENVPLSSQPWVWVAGTMVGLAVVLLLLRPFTTWYWSHYPPTIEHRRELLEKASKELNCPAEQLVIKPVGQTGAEVTGCDSDMKVCWSRVLGRRSRRTWAYCPLP